MSGEDPGLAPPSEQEDDTAGQPDIKRGPEDDLHQIRSSWKFAAIVQFCRLFKEVLRVRAFSADNLESAILSPESHRIFLGELLYKLLKSSHSQRAEDKELELCEQLLKRKLSRQWGDYFTENPLETSDFYAVEPQTRLLILYALCEWRASECPEVQEYIRQTADGGESGADQLRHVPIGEDARGRRYFFFSDNNEDCRVYREEPPRKRVGKKVPNEDVLWDTPCTVLEEIGDLIAQLGASRNKNEKLLHQVLSAAILPRLVDTANARRRAEEKAALIEAAPQKRSSRIQVLAIKKEEEDKKKAEENEERERLEKERERRKRESRSLKGQDAESRRAAFAAELNRRALGLSDGPSREERMMRRTQMTGNDDFFSGFDSNPESRRVSPSSSMEPQRHPGFGGGSGMGGYGFSGAQTPKQSGSPVFLGNLGLDQGDMGDDPLRDLFRDDDLEPPGRMQPMMERDRGGFDPLLDTQGAQVPQRHSARSRAMQRSRPPADSPRGRNKRPLDVAVLCNVTGLQHYKRQRTTTRIPRTDMLALTRAAQEPALIRQQMEAAVGGQGMTLGADDAASPRGGPRTQQGGQRHPRAAEKPRPKPEPRAAKSSEEEEQRSHTPQFMQVPLRSNRQARLSSKLRDSIIDEDLNGDDEDEYLPERDRKKGGSRSSGARPLQRSPERPPPSRERQDMRTQMAPPSQQLQHLQMQFMQARETYQRMQARADMNEQQWQAQFPLSTAEERQKIQQSALQQRQVLSQHARNVQALAERIQREQLAAQGQAPGPPLQEGLMQMQQAQAMRMQQAQAAQLAAQQQQQQAAMAAAQAQAQAQSQAAAMQQTQLIRNLLESLSPEQRETFHKLPEHEKRKFLASLHARYVEMRKPQRAGSGMQTGQPGAGAQGGPASGMPGHMGSGGSGGSGAQMGGQGGSGGAIPMGQQGGLQQMGAGPMRMGSQGGMPMAQQGPMGISGGQAGGGGMPMGQQGSGGAQGQGAGPMQMGQQGSGQPLGHTGGARPIGQGVPAVQMGGQATPQQLMLQQQQQKEAMFQHQKRIVQQQILTNLTPMQRASLQAMQPEEQARAINQMVQRHLAARAQMQQHQQQQLNSNFLPPAQQMPGGFSGQNPALRQQQQQQQAAAIAAMRSGVAAGQAAGRFGMPGTSPAPGSPAVGGSMQPPRSPMGAQGQASSGPLAPSRPGSGTYSVGGPAASPGLAPSRPGSGVFGSGVLQGRASGAASPAPGQVPGRASPAPSLNQPTVAHNPQGPPRPLSPPGDAHQAPTTAHDSLATLMGPMVSANTPAVGLIPSRGRSGGSRAQQPPAQRSRMNPLSPTPLSHMGSWDASGQYGDAGGLRSGGDSIGNLGPSTSASPPIPSSPRHRQMMPHQGTPPGSHGAPITTGVGGVRPTPVDLLGRSTPPPGTASVTTGVTGARPSPSPGMYIELASSSTVGGGPPTSMPGQGSLTPMGSLPNSGRPGTPQRLAITISGSEPFSAAAQDGMRAPTTSNMANASVATYPQSLPTITFASGVAGGAPPSGAGFAPSGQPSPSGAFPPASQPLLGSAFAPSAMRQPPQRSSFDAGLLRPTADRAPAPTPSSAHLMGFGPAALVPTPVADIGWQDSESGDLAAMAEAFLFDDERPGSGPYADPTLGTAPPPASQPAPSPAVAAEMPEASGGPAVPQELLPTRENNVSIPKVTPLVEPVETLEPGRPPGETADAPPLGNPPQSGSQGGNQVAGPEMLGVAPRVEEAPPAPFQSVSVKDQLHVAPIVPPGVEGLAVGVPPEAAVREEGSLPGQPDTAVGDEKHVDNAGALDEPHSDAGMHLGNPEGSVGASAPENVSMLPPLSADHLQYGSDPQAP